MRVLSSWAVLLLGAAPLLHAAPSSIYEDLDLPYAPHINTTLVQSLVDEDFEKRQSRPALRIMPLGASTVYGVGSSHGNGFRQYLRDQARATGFEVNMVGTKRGGSMTDNECEATSGEIIAQIHDSMKLSYKFKPNVVVINGGTNDLIQGIDINNQKGRMGDLIQDIWNNIGADTVVVLSTLLPCSVGNADANRAVVNPAYRDLVAELHASGYPIYLADMDPPSGTWITASEVPDGIHPDDNGFKKMASAFWAGIAQAYSDGNIKEPGEIEDQPSTDPYCRKIAGNGIWAGSYTQLGSGLHDGIYYHKSQNMGTLLTITSDWDRDQWFFARLFRQDRDDLLGWFQNGDGDVRYGVWRNDGGGGFTKIADLNVNDNCIPRGIHFVDLNGDGLDDFACVAPSGAVFASINQGNGGGSNPPSFRNIGVWKDADPAYPQAQVRLADMDGDGRADFIGLALNGDTYIWRNGWIDDTPKYFQYLGKRFTGKGMGDLRGTRFEDINGDGRDDWLWVSDTGATTTYTNARSCWKGRDGDGLNIAWRQGFLNGQSSGPTHLGNFGDDVRDRIHFARIYGEPQDFGLLGRQDYVFMEHSEDGDKHKFSMRVFKNIGSGGTKLVADGNKYCDMTGNGRDDYVWTLSKGEMTIYPNGGKDIISDGESYWGPSAIIFRPRNYVGRDLNRRDLHLADWDGDGKCDIIWTDPDNQNRISVFRNLYSGSGGWNWDYQSNPAPSMYCPERRGLGIHDNPVRFADISGSGRADYICLEKDGRAWGWTQGSSGEVAYIDQFKSSKGYDRANLWWADVNGDGKADAIWTDKFSGDGYVFYNKGRRDVGGSRYEWEQQSGGGPFHAYSGNQAGTCVYYPDLDGNHRADQHNIEGTWTNKARTWYNTCGGLEDRTGDDGAVGFPGIPDYPFDTIPDPDVPVEDGPPPYTYIPAPPDSGFPEEPFPSVPPPDPTENCRDPQPFMAFPGTVGKSTGGTLSCAAKWNKGAMPTVIYAEADARMVRYIEIEYTDGSKNTYGIKPADDGEHRRGTVKWNPWTQHFSQFDLYEATYSLSTGVPLGRMVIAVAGCEGDNCRMDVGAYIPGVPPITLPRGVNDRGMLLGFLVRHGDGIDALQPYFSSTAIAGIYMDSATFTPTFEELNQKPFEERQIDVAAEDDDFDNRKSSSATTYMTELSITTTQMFKVTRTDEDGAEHGGEFGLTTKTQFEFHMGIPWLFEVSAKPNLDISGKYVGKKITKTINSREDMEQKAYLTRHRITKTVEAGEWMACGIVALNSKANLRYNAMIVASFEDGKNFSYPVTGMFHSAEYTKAHDWCEDLPLDGASAKRDVMPRVRDVMPRARDVISRIRDMMPRARNVEIRGVETRDVDPDSIVIQSAYCPDGSVAGPAGMSDDDFLKACGLEGMEIRTVEIYK